MICLHFLHLLNSVSNVKFPKKSKFTDPVSINLFWVYFIFTCNFFSGEFCWRLKFVHKCSQVYDVTFIQTECKKPFYATDDDQFCVEAFLVDKLCTFSR